MNYLPPLALPHCIDILTINNVIVNKQQQMHCLHVAAKIMNVDLGQI